MNKSLIFIKIRQLFNFCKNQCVFHRKKALKHQKVKMRPTADAKKKKNYNHNFERTRKD